MVSHRISVPQAGNFLETATIAVCLVQRSSTTEYKSNFLAVVVAHRRTQYSRFILYQGMLGDALESCLVPLGLFCNK